MKVTVSKRIGFYEIDSDYKLRLKPLLNVMQEAAATHSDLAGCSTAALLAEGRAWVLHRMVLQVHRPPALGDELSVITWHKGSRGFRSYRDFEILAEEEKLVSAASLWLLIDTRRKRILKVPPDVAERYGSEEIDGLEINIDQWKPDLAFEPDITVPVAIRPSDYDPLGHVNNALYFDYLETLMENALEKPGKKGRLGIEFNKEIPRGVDSVAAGLKTEASGFIFKFASSDAVHAAGQFRPESLELRTESHPKD